MSTRSVAVWCAGRAGSPRTEYEVHANYWRLSGDADFNRRAGLSVPDLLEIGVRIVNVAAVELIRLWVPFKIGRDQVEDCSRYFRDTNIAQGIFNDVLRITAAGPTGPRCIELSGPTAVLCRVHCFSRNGAAIDASELDVQDEAGGTMLTITRAALALASTAAANSPADTYFRLRMPTKGGRGFVTTLRPRDHALQSGYEVVEYIDFRLNEARTLPDPVEARMRADHAGAAELKLVALLTAVPILSNIAVSSTQSHKMRVLEHELWRPYVPGALPPHMMVYHWKRERGLVGSAQGSTVGPPIQDFSAFIKLSTRRTDRGTLVIYLLIAFAFGVLGNLVAAWIQHLVENG